MKTFIGAVIGVLIIILIVVFARGHKSSTTNTSETDTTKTSVQQNTTPTDTKPMNTTSTNTTPGALQITTTHEGTGAGAKTGDTVTVNYTGMLTNGTVFDSNVDPKFQHVQPFSFTLGQNMVIQGWEQGVLGMKVGEKRHLVIPATLGYGDRGAGALIPPGATLTFDVEVISIGK